MLQRRIEPAESGIVPKHFVSRDACGSIPIAARSTIFLRQAGGAFSQALITLALFREQSTFPVGAPLGSLQDNRCSERRRLPWSKANRFVQPLFEDALACQRAFVAPCRWLFGRKRADSRQHRTLRNPRAFNRASSVPFLTSTEVLTRGGCASISVDKKHRQVVPLWGLVIQRVLNARFTTRSFDLQQVGSREDHI
jgi:hypothetical protein